MSPAANNRSNWKAEQFVYVEKIRKRHDYPRSNKAANVFLVKQIYLQFLESTVSPIKFNNADVPWFAFARSTH